MFWYLGGKKRSRERGWLSRWMSRHRPDNPNWAERHRQTPTTRHAHEDVLTDREFERLLEARATLPAPRDLQARFIVCSRDGWGCGLANSHTSKLAGSTGTATSCASRSKSRASVATVTARQSKKPP